MRLRISRRNSETTPPRISHRNSRVMSSKFTGRVGVWEHTTLYSKSSIRISHFHLPQGGPTTRPGSPLCYGEPRKKGGGTRAATLFSWSSNALARRTERPHLARQPAAGGSHLGGGFVSFCPGPGSGPCFALAEEYAAGRCPSPVAVGTYNVCGRVVHDFSPVSMKLIAPEGRHVPALGRQELRTRTSSEFLPVIRRWRSREAPPRAMLRSEQAAPAGTALACLRTGLRPGRFSLCA